MKQRDAREQSLATHRPPRLFSGALARLCARVGRCGRGLGVGRVRGCAAGAAVPVWAAPKGQRVGWNTIICLVSLSVRSSISALLSAAFQQASDSNGPVGVFISPSVHLSGEHLVDRGGGAKADGAGRDDDTLGGLERLPQVHGELQRQTRWSGAHSTRGCRRGCHLTRTQRMPTIMRSRFNSISSAHSRHRACVNN